MKGLEKRHKIEQEFYNQGKPAAGRFERALLTFMPAMDEKLMYARIWKALGVLNDKYVLELGCGHGDLTLRLANRGANVCAMDISMTEVEACTNSINEANLQGKVRVQQMAAEHLSYPDGIFDIVTGISVLHHTEIPLTIKEIHRVLKPGGKGIFLEPLGHNTLVNLWRKLTPHYRTSSEHPLLFKDIKEMEKTFTMVRHSEFRLLTLFIIPIVKVATLNNKWTIKIVRRAFESIEPLLLQVIAPLRRMCGSTLIEVIK